MRAAGETTKFADGGGLGSQKRERGVRGTFAYRTWRLRHLRVRSVGLETHATADVEIGVPAIRCIYLQRGFLRQLTAFKRLLCRRRWAEPLNVRREQHRHG